MDAVNQGADKFEEWCIVEIMGHARFAGRVTEQPLGGSSFVRVDVPAVNEQPAFTKLFGAGSIYAITPCTEEVARAAAAGFRAIPVDRYALLPPPQAKRSDYAADDEF